MTFGAAGKIDVHAMLKPGLVWIGYYTRPSLLIIGAAKCGTTALHQYLCQHPLIRPAWDKEIHFFDQDVSYRRGLTWYQTRFPLPHKMPRGGVTFEATPDYLYFSRCAARVHRYDPNIKLLVILREPVERAYSFWNMLRNFHAVGGRAILENVRRFDPPIREAYRTIFSAERVLDFDEFINRELENTGNDEPEIQPNLVQYGLYAMQLKRYLQRFDRQQLLVLHSRQLLTEPRRTLDQVTDFIGLPRCQWNANIDRRVFDLPYVSAMQADTRARLCDFYRPHNAELYELLGADLGW